MICLEVVTNEGDELPCTTACDHVFHASCWRDYCLSCASYDAAFPSSCDLVRLFLYVHAGPPCPVCRAEFPQIDRLAYAVQDAETMQVMHAAGVRGLNVDLSLDLAAKETKKVSVRVA